MKFFEKLCYFIMILCFAISLTGCFGCFTKTTTANNDLKDYLTEIDEPKYFIVAPMTYDTSKFIAENRTEKKDKSRERHILLEEAISKFENYIDEKPGFSFIDRSKIAQIEKEHKFQLSDWSNDKKTAEIGRALNANVLLFLDKFNYLDMNGGEYRFEAKIVDINTMQTISYLLIYTGKKLKPPVETLEKINFRNFTSLHSETNPFNKETELKNVKVIKTVQSSKITFGRNLKSCPFGYVEKMDVDNPDELKKIKDTDILNFDFIYLDGTGVAELKSKTETKNASYVFEPIDTYIEVLDNSFYTDGRIGALSINTDGFYQKYDVFSVNNREYYIQLGSIESKKTVENYYALFVAK